MKSLIHRSLLIVVVLMLISSTSYANLKKGKIGSGSTRQFEYIPPTNGVNLLSLIFDNASTDLDLAIGLEDGTLVAVSISPDRFFETLQVGLVGNTRYIIMIESFEGPASAFRIVGNSAQQETIASAVHGDGLREVAATSAGNRLRDSLRKVSKVKK